MQNWGRETGVKNLSKTKEGGGMASRTIAKFALSYQNYYIRNDL